MNNVQNLITKRNNTDLKVNTVKQSLLENKHLREAFKSLSVPNTWGRNVAVVNLKIN